MNVLNIVVQLAILITGLERLGDQPSGVPPYSSETTVLVNRSVIETRIIEPDELRVIQPSGVPPYSSETTALVNGSVIETRIIEPDELRVIQPSGVPPCSSETTALVNRSVIETKIIAPDELTRLITEQKFSNEVHYVVNGDFSLEGSLDLTGLPKNLSVKRKLSLNRCTALTALPENLTVKGNLSLTGCTGLTALPENLTVEGKLTLRNCNSLRVLPENLTVGGGLILRDCTGLTALPETLSVGGDVWISYCSALTALPENLTVEGKLSLNYCTGLTALPENLTVEGNLSLSNCTALTALPETLSVGGDVWISDCSALTALPENLTVKGGLNLRKCTALTALPENLTVRSFIDLSDCTGLTALPENLTVRGCLDLSYCTGLTALPETLVVDGDLYLTGCTALTALPNWITTMGATPQGDTRTVILENTGLSDELINRLREYPTPGMQFYSSRRAGQPVQRFSNVQEALTFWRNLAPSDPEIPELNIPDNQAPKLVEYMERLTSTADYKNKATRPLLAQRVIAVTSLLTGSDEMREDALQYIDDALASCDDRIALALDDLETLQLLNSADSKAFEGNPEPLKALGLQMMRLDKVKQIAHDHTKTLNWVDPIEVELAFRIGVSKTLTLPGSTQDMIFTRCAQVSNEDIHKAVNQVNTYCSDDDNLKVYLAQWTPWQQYQRLQEVPAFDQLTPKSVEHIDRCDFTVEKTNQMVQLNDKDLDYDALVKAFVKDGKNPYTGDPLNWSSVVRLTEDAPIAKRLRRRSSPFGKACPGSASKARKPT